MRIQINLNEETLKRVDEEAKRIGVARGSMLSTWIGEKVNALDQSRNMFRDILENKEMKKLLASALAKENKTDAKERRKKNAK